MNTKGKKILEYSGDTKTNQQTASKVDCNIVINNNTASNKTSESKVFKSKNGEDIRIINNVERFGSESTDNETSNIESIQGEITIDDNVRKPIPITNKPVYYVSRFPIVTRDAIENNIQFHKTRSECLAALVNKVPPLYSDGHMRTIFTKQNIIDMISAALTTSDYCVTPSDITLQCEDNINFDSTCLCMTKITMDPFQKLVSIKINGQDFCNIQNEAYNVLCDVYKISLTSVYGEEQL